MRVPLGLLGHARRSRSTLAQPGLLPVTRARVAPKGRTATIRSVRRPLRMTVRPERERSERIRWEHTKSRVERRAARKNFA